MPIDPNLVLGIKPVNAPDPLEILGKVQNYRNLIQQNQYRDQEIKNSQAEGQIKQRQIEASDRELADNETFSKGLAANKGDFDATFKQLAETGAVAPDSLLKRQKAYNDTVESHAKRSTAELADENAKLTTIGGGLEAILQSPPEAQPAAYAQFYQQAVADPRLGEIAKTHLPINFDPQKIAQLRWMGQAQEKINEAAIRNREQHNKDIEAADTHALAPFKQREAEAKAISAEQTSTGAEPIQPLDQIKLNMTESENAAKRSQDERMERHRLASEERLGRLASASLGQQTNTRINQISSQFDNEPLVRNYGVVSEAKSFIDSLGKDKPPTSADDQGLLYAFAKVMDPGSVVREGEYNTVQKYAQSWAQTMGFKAERIFSNTPFLTDEARKNLKETIANKVDASKKQYDNVFSEYGRRIQEQAGVPDGKKYLTDYSRATTNAAPGGITTPATQDEYNALPKGAQFKKPNDNKVYTKQ